MLTALVPHSQRQVILEPPDGHEYSLGAELALRYAAARHPDRWPCVNAREPLVPVFQVAYLQPARRATRYAASPMTLTTAMLTLAFG
jgi:hypothetical protein